MPGLWTKNEYAINPETVDLYRYFDATKQAEFWGWYL